jgi:hypothetical protein
MIGGIQMELHVNVLEVSEEALNTLNHEQSVEDNKHGHLEFVSRDIFCHASGFHSDQVVFKHENKHFRFLATGYLDDAYWTFTKPFEVFQNVETYTRTTYTSWVKEVV